MNRAAWVGLGAIAFMFAEPWIKPLLDRRPRPRPDRPPDLVEDRNRVRGTITRPGSGRDLEPWDGGS